LGLAIGTELRARRVKAGLTQAAVGAPLTRAFVSSVERGHTVPSIAALALLTDRLGIDLGVFFEGVNDHMTRVYSPGHGRSKDQTTGGCR
jgi:transcriptional regulator with XRE-family HTH domain